jgi:hypothetical protein
VDVAIAIGQGAGLAVACGLLAALPLAVAALAALIFGVHSVEPEADTVLGNGLLVAVLCVLAVADLVVAPRLPQRPAIVLRAIGGAVIFELVLGRELHVVGAIAGLALAAFSAVVGVRLVSSAAHAGSALSASLVAGAAAIAAAILALVPFVGYLIVAAAVFLFVRERRQVDGKYAGLRILR